MKTSWRHVLKTSWWHVLKTSSRRLGDKQNIYWGIPVVANLNVYNFANLYLTNLMRIQNAWMHTTEIHLNKNLFKLTLRFTFKKYFYIKKKKSSTFANLLMEKLGNWTAIAKMWKNTRRKKLRKASASLLKDSLWDTLQFLLVQINHLVSL